ncbi:hypothetical protein HDV00_003493 [Rhizophlyctis rosea]|nr:hypothetical protein HDV00_003493 [Rhizophlyctis rosea]
MSAESTPSLIVHHLNNSRSQRILWLLEELQVPYTLKKYQRQPNHKAPPELFAIHPLGKSPVITDGDITVAETGAIIEYIVSKYGNGRLIPTGEADKRKCTYWLHFTEGSLMPYLVQKLIANIVPTQTPFFIRPVAKAVMGGVESNLLDPEIKNHLNFIESQLPEGGYFAGPDLSVADVMLSFPLEACEAQGRGELGPKCKEWLKRIHARDAYKKALEKGGDYAYAKM